MKKGSKFYSILEGNVRIVTEEIFLFRPPYNLRKMGDIYESCQLCNRTFNPEPGFYFGAMYVSYAMGVGLLAVVWFSNF